MYTCCAVHIWLQVKSSNFVLCYDIVIVLLECAALCASQMRN